MKTSTPFRFPLVMAIVAALAAFLSSAASAQLLDGAWFKLRFVAKGRTLDTNQVTLQRLNYTQPLYAQFVSTTNGPKNYRISIWTEGETGWSNSTTLTETTIGRNENFISDLGSIELQRNSSGEGVSVYMTPFINTRTNLTGTLRSATFDGTGEIYSGTISGKEYYGSCTLRGATVDPSKLPFTP